jgi:hypothetical protein
MPKAKRNKDNGESTKWWRPATAAPSNFSYDAPSTPKRLEPSSTFKKESIVDTALLPGPKGPRVSPGSEWNRRRRPMTPSRKKWCHSKAAPHQGRTSRHRFLPIPAHKKQLRRKGVPSPIFAAHLQAPPRSCGQHPRLFETNGAWPVRWWYTTLPGQRTAASQPRGRSPPPPPSKPENGSV